MLVGIFVFLGPPNSPPPNWGRRLSNMTKIATPAQEQNKNTEYPKLKHNAKVVLSMMMKNLSFIHIMDAKKLYKKVSNTCQGWHWIYHTRILACPHNRSNLPCTHGRKLQWSRRYQYRGRHWQRYYPLRYQQRHQRTHPGWLLLCWQKYLWFWLVGDSRVTKIEKNNFNLCVFPYFCQ